MVCLCHQGHAFGFGVCGAVHPLRHPIKHGIFQKCLGLSRFCRPYLEDLSGGEGNTFRPLKGLIKHMGNLAGEGLGNLGGLVVCFCHQVPQPPARFGFEGLGLGANRTSGHEPHFREVKETTGYELVVEISALKVQQQM